MKRRCEIMATVVRGVSVADGRIYSTNRITAASSRRPNSPLGQCHGRRNLLTGLLQRLAATILRSAARDDVTATRLRQAKHNHRDFFFARHVIIRAPRDRATCTHTYAYIRHNPSMIIGHSPILGGVTTRRPIYGLENSATTRTIYRGASISPKLARSQTHEQALTSVLERGKSRMFRKTDAPPIFSAMRHPTRPVGE